MSTYGVDLMGRRRRRRHSAEFKATVIQECLKPGVSIAAVALAHGLNANMLRKWVVDAEHKFVLPMTAADKPIPDPAPMPPPTFVPLALPAPVVDGVGGVNYLGLKADAGDAELRPRSRDSAAQGL